MADLKVLKRLVDNSPEDAGAAVAGKPPRRKPGRPKGSAKWPGSGRKKGGANQTTTEIRAKIHRRGKPVEKICDVAPEPISRTSPLGLRRRRRVGRTAKCVPR